MPADVFGDLQEWGNVLETLDDLRRAEVLDRHQSGLARLIRYRNNWRLQEEALASAAQVRKPSRILVEVTLRVLENTDELLENRILAAHALGSMLAVGRSEPECELNVDDVISTMRDLLSNGGPPILHRAVRNACEQAVSIS